MTVTRTQPESVTFPLWGGTATVAVTEPAALGAASAAVREVVHAFDLACSPFRQDSELAAVNAGAGAPVPVGETLLEATAVALRAAQLTEGDVDPTVGQALAALGLHGDPPVGGPVIASVPGWRVVGLDRTASTIRVPLGVRLDLGATAKALAADRAAHAARRTAGCGVLVSLGGDLAIAGPPPQEGWRVRVTDDHRSSLDAPGQWITLLSGGLATSSTTVRRSEAAQGTAHHLIDPAKAAPAAGPWRTVSVAAGSCLDANIASTAAVVRGEAAVAWLRQQGLPSRLVSNAAKVVHVAGWPSEADDLA